MENLDVIEEMDLPPGFRFQPTDEELITHYLSPKVIDVTFSARAIGEVDLNKCEPWDLPKKARMGGKEWYFFCVRDRKYPSGLRTNRATEAGYWKATGKDKEIYREKILVGMKKTLVFYKGRAPKGHKSNWVMHEFRRQGNSVIPSNSRNEWVICRVFQKNEAGKKIPFEELIRSDSFGSDYNPSTNLPPLMEASPYNANICAPHVSCFSTSMEITQTSHYHTNDQPFFDGSINNTLYSQIASSFGDNSCYYNSKEFGVANIYYDIQKGQNPEDPILKAILENGAETKTEVADYSVSYDTGLSGDMNHEISSVVSNYDAGPMPFGGSDGPSTSVTSVDLGLLWNS